MDNNHFNQPQQQRRFVERRRKPDWVTRAIPLLSIIGWFIAAAALFMIDRARPRTSENFFTRLSSSGAFSTVDTRLLYVAFISLIMTFVLCLTGFIFNMTRHKRKSDKYNPSIIILGALSLVAIAAFLILYGRFL